MKVISTGDDYIRIIPNRNDAYRRLIIIIIIRFADDRTKNRSINLPSSFDALPSLLDRRNICRARRDRKPIGNHITMLVIH